MAKATIAIRADAVMLTMHVRVRPRHARLHKNGIFCRFLFFAFLFRLSIERIQFYHIYTSRYVHVRESNRSIIYKHKNEYILNEM